MPKGNWDNMNRDGNTGIGLLGLLGLFAAGGIAKSVSNSKKEQEVQQKRAQLQVKLNEVQKELSKKRGNILREAWYSSEIEELERQEAVILRQLKELGG